MKINKIMNKWGNSSVKDVFLKIFSSPTNLFYTVLFDGLFFFLFYILGFLVNDIFGLKPGLDWLRVLYLICVIAVYSIFKFLVLDIIKSFFRNSEKSDYKRIGGFFLLNTVIILFMLVFILAINFIAGFFVDFSSVAQNITTQGVPVFIIIEIIITALVFYPLINIAHSLFSEGKKAGKCFWEAAGSVFLKFRDYSFTYVFLILIFLGMGIAFTIADVAMNSLLRPEILNSFYPAFVTFLAFFSMFAFYLVHVYNRVYFMNAVKKSKI